MINVGIIGATGYAGVELVRLLLSHPQVKLAALGSVSFEGKPLSAVYPNLAGVCEDTLVGDDAVLQRSDVVFASLPHGLSEKYAALCEKSGKLFIDLGADFRLHDEADYKQWYGLDYSEAALHKNAMYALPELYREEIRGKKLLGNPGCYPTSVALGLAPALKADIVSTSGIVIDSKSGVTGAGRGLTQTSHYPDCNEAFSPYKIASHRHIPEIEQTLSQLAGSKIVITFVPHLLPVNRGIISTMYLSLSGETTESKVHELYNNFYANERFVRICPIGVAANLRNVRMSNYCDISVHVDARAGKLIVVSAIDNMVKGAAGQAIQNMNIALGLPEESGLLAIPPAF